MADGSRQFVATKTGHAWPVVSRKGGGLPLNPGRAHRVSRVGDW
jgi:hypothetical protein